LNLLHGRLSSSSPLAIICSTPAGYTLQLQRWSIPSRSCMASSPSSALLQIAGCRAGYRSGASVHTQQHRIDGARRRRSAVEWHRTSLRLTGNNSQTNHAHARQAAATATWLCHWRLERKHKRPVVLQISLFNCLRGSLSSSSTRASRHSISWHMSAISLSDHRSYHPRGETSQRPAGNSSQKPTMVHERYACLAKPQLQFDFPGDDLNGVFFQQFQSFQDGSSGSKIVIRKRLLKCIVLLGMDLLPPSWCIGLARTPRSLFWAM
jgi:hypothetical protein